MMVTKYSADAINEIAENGRKVDEHKREVVKAARLYRTVKTWLLIVAMLGVTVGLYFARDLGWLAATVASREPDPSLVAPPKSNAKQLRKMKELKKERQSELDEIEGFDSPPKHDDAEPATP